jgi:DNA-binding MarR family transcriptional regulator
MVHLALTEDGAAMTRALTPITMNFWNEMLDGFSPTEAEVLIGLLTRLLHRMEKSPVAAQEAAE